MEWPVEGEVYIRTIEVSHITEIKLNISNTNVDVEQNEPRSITRTCDTRRGQQKNSS